MAKLIEFTEGGDTRFFDGYCHDAIKLAREFFAEVLAAVPDEMIP